MTRPKNPSAPGASSLSYRDVFNVLALAKGWDKGRVRFSDGDLTVDMVLGEVESGPRPRTIVAAQAVGFFKALATTGAKVSGQMQIGVIEAPGRTTPVLAPSAGTLARLLVEPGGFVQYGQALVDFEPAEPRG